MPYMRKLHPYIDILVSNIGEVFVPASGKHKAHWTFGSKQRNGYLRVTINGKHYYVHRLVAQTYLPNPSHKPQINHLNRNREDNRVENLSWCTVSENNRDTSANDRVDARGGTHWYDDPRSYYRERDVRYKERNPEKYREKQREYGSRYYANKRKTCKVVQFSDGKNRWLPNSEALLLLAIPVSQRIYKG